MRVLDDLIAELREVCSSFVDKRRGRNGRYTMADIGLSAFSVFFMQSPSFLAHQKMLEARRGRSNCASLFAMAKIPPHHLHSHYRIADRNGRSARARSSSLRYRWRRHQHRGPSGVVVESGMTFGGAAEFEAVFGASPAAALGDATGNQGQGTAE